MGIVRYADFRISRKLLCLLTLVAIPFGLMTWSYVDQARKDISFASRELDGVRYLQSLTPLLTAPVGHFPLLLNPPRWRSRRPER